MDYTPEVEDHGMNCKKKMGYLNVVSLYLGCCHCCVVVASCSGWDSRLCASVDLDSGRRQYCLALCDVEIVGADG
jgi:hypothetical protein